ncbi:unnamed protein product [Paramecium sonneborni]|uniref:Uncharacterized protein n=1 Tax=Paramecium sonneborni TaxID=65129 RepID=A0A8S1LAT1_9CILI|nr:unnamed protein product [Paramecium sonneborni]
MFLRVYRVKEEKQTLQLDYNQVRNQLEQSLKNYEILQSQQLIIQKAEYLPGTDVKNQTRSQHHQKLLLVDSKLRRQILILRLIREIRIIKEIRKLSTIKSFEIKGLQKDLEFEQNRRNFKKKRMKQIYNYFSKEKIKQLEQQLQEVNTKNQELNREKVILETKINIDTQNVERLNELFQQNLQLEKRIADYKVQVGSSNDQIKKLQSTSQIEIRGQIINGQDLVSAERIQNYEIKIIKLNAELVNFQQLLNENQKQLSDVKEKCHQNYQKIMELEKNVEDLTYLLKEKERLIKEREQNINQISIKYQESKRVQIIYQHIKKYKEIAQQVDPKKVLEIDSEIFKVEERLSALEEQRNQEQIREEEQRQKELDVRQKKLKQEQQQYSDLLQKSKVQKYKTIQFLKMQMLESHGIIEVGLLLNRCNLVYGSLQTIGYVMYQRKFEDNKDQNKQRLFMGNYWLLRF